MAVKRAAVNYSGQWALIQPGDTLTAPLIEASTGAFTSPTPTAVLSATNGTVYLRPNGQGYESTQAWLNSVGTFHAIHFESEGSVQFGGDIDFATHLKASTTMAVLSANGSPSAGVYLRPNGYLNIAGEANVDSAGILRVNATGVGTPATGQTPGIVIRNTDPAATALSGLTFYGTDDTAQPRHGASITMYKPAAWVGGSTVYPGGLSLWTRPAVAGSSEFEAVRLLPDGHAFFYGPITVLGPQIRFQDYLQSQTVNCILSAMPGGIVLLRPNGAVTTTGEVSITSNGTTSINGALVVNGPEVRFKDYLQSQTTFACLNTQPGGTIVLRPNGPGDVTGEVGLNSAGALSVNGELSVGGALTLKHNPGTGAGAWHNGATTTHRAFVGLDDSSENFWRVYSSSIPANALTVDLTNGAVTAAGKLDANGDRINFNTYLESKTNLVIIGNTGTGGAIYFRPRGIGDGTAQAAISEDGTFSTNGRIDFNDYLVSKTPYWIGGANGPGGAIYLRPNGIGSAVGEFRIDTNGSVIGHNFIAQGSLSAFQFYDRGAGGSSSIWYMAGNVARLFNSTNAIDLLAVTDLGRLDVAKTVRAMGIQDPTSGVGVEINYNTPADKGTLVCYDRTNALYKPLTVAASFTELRAGGTMRIRYDATGLGFNDKLPIAKPVVSGSVGGNAALASLIVALDALGLITNSTSP